MEYCKDLSKKARDKAAVCYDLNLSSSSSGSDSEVTPGQGTEAGRTWTAQDSDGEVRTRPAAALPELGDHDIPQQPQLEPIVPPPPEIPQQPHLEQPRGPPGFNPRVRIQE